MTMENCKICQHLIVYSSIKSKSIQHAGTASINTQPPNHETTEITNKNRSIKQWEAQFKKKNGREPTEEDKYESLPSQELNYCIDIFRFHIKSV